MLDGDPLSYGDYFMLIRSCISFFEPMEGVYFIMGSWSEDLLDNLSVLFWTVSMHREIPLLV